MKDKISWQEKRVAAITRWSNKKGIPCSDNNPYLMSIVILYIVKQTTRKNIK